MIDLKELIQNASEIPPLPASAARLASLVLDEREDRDLDEIVEAVTYDPVLTGKVLRWANSVVSGSAEQILTVKEALIRMGTGPLLQVVIASNVKPQMAKALPEYGLSEEELWHHSVASALAVNAFQRTLTINIPKEAFVAALLHDIGILILSRYLDDEHLKWLKIL